MKTRNSPSTTRNWNVDVLLHNPMQRGIRYDRRHFHQLFRLLRIAHDSAQWDIIEQDLRHFDDMLEIRQKRVEEAHDVRQLFHHLRHKCIKNLHHGATRTRSTMCSTVRRPSPATEARREPRAAPPGVFVKQLEEHRFPGCFGPCPSSVPVGRRTFHEPPPCRSCGGRLRTGPLRRSAAHVSTMSGAVAVAASSRLPQRVRRCRATTT